MSKKDYERAAIIVQEVHTKYGTEAAANVGAAFGVFFTLDGNPRFDAERFIKACTPGANVKARPKRARVSA